MTAQDTTLLAITCYRENRGGGITGMTSVANAIMNRVAKKGTDAYSECTEPLQFSSITAKGDAQLGLWPKDSDPEWQQALSIASQAAAGTLVDLTNGSTLYYAPAAIKTTESISLPYGKTIPFPEGWNPAVVTYQTTIEGQVFFTEK